MATLTIRDLHVSRGDREVIRGVDLDVTTGEACALMGASGAGKTTILRVVAALEPFMRGSVTVGDASLRPGPLPPQSALGPLRARVGLVFQSHALFEHLTVLQNITLAPTRALGWSRERAEHRARDLLDSLDVAHRAGAYPAQLSGGEAQRVAIARALAPDPALLLMDEPTSALDADRRSALAATLRSLVDSHRALLISTHDEAFARACADRVVRLADGRVV